MKDTPPSAPEPPDHAWVHERLAAALLGGLSAEEQSRFDAHINACPECFDDFTDAKAADRDMQRALSALSPAPDFEQNILQSFREKTMPKPYRLLLRRAGMAIAAAVALAATGVFAQYAIRSDSVTAPLSERLAANAQSQGITLPDFWNSDIESRGGTQIRQASAITKSTGDLYTRQDVHDAIVQLAANQTGTFRVGAGISSDSDTTIYRAYEAQRPPTILPEGGKLLQTNKELSRKVNEEDTARIFADESIGKLKDQLKARVDSPKEFMQKTDPVLAIRPPNYYPSLSKSDTTSGDRTQQQNFVSNFNQTMGRTMYGKTGTQHEANLDYYKPALALAPQITDDRTVPSAESQGRAQPFGVMQATLASGTNTSAPFDIAMVPTAKVAAGDREGADHLAQARSEQVGTLMKQARDLSDQGKYNEAADALRRTLVIDPNNELARSQLKQDVTIYRAHGDDADHSREAQRLSVDSMEHHVPYTDLLVYPENWAELTQNHLAETGTDSSQNRQVQSVLEQNMKEVSAEKQPLDKVVNFLRDSTNTNIFVDWKALEAAGINRNTPISVNLKEVPYNKVLNTILAQAAGDKKLGYKIEDGVITISTDVPSAATQAASGQPAADIAPRKIIRNGSVEFEVRSFDDASATISAVVGEEGGFVSSTSSDKLANGKIRGTIVVRVPPDHLDRTLLKLRALGDLKTQQISANDVTKEYTDIDSELRALRAMESRLIDLIKNGKGDVKDLVVAEKQLGEYRVRIEKLEGDERYYNNLVGMATLSIVLYEKDIQKPTAASESEQVALALETDDVETKYNDARKILDDAKGRIVDSELKKYDADQFTASIVVDVPPDKADFVAAQLKQIGTVANYTRDRKQTTTGGSGAPTVQVQQEPTRFTITLYNLANVAPREVTVLTVAVRDVDATYRKIIALVRQPAPIDNAKNRHDVPPPKPVGRVITSNMSGQLPQQMTADIRADVQADEAATVLQAIQDSGEVITSTSTENADTANTTASKRGIQLRLVNAAAVPARETQTLRAVADDVADSYNRLLAALQGIGGGKTGAGIRVIASQLTQTDPRTVTASLSFEAARSVLPAVDKAFADAGINFLARNVVRSNDAANTLDSKVLFQIDSLIPTDSLPPRLTTILGVEVPNVEKALDSLRTSLSPTNVREIEYNVTTEATGRVTGHLIVETPVANAMAALSHIKDLGGVEKVNQVMKDNQVPDAPFARERIDLTLTSPAALVENGKGFAATIRAALASSAAALLLSLYYVITGVLFLGPFLIVIWIIYRLARRRRPAST